MCDTYTAYEYFEAGIFREQDKDNCGALGCYEKALELAPMQPDLWFRKGLILLALGWDEEADVCLDKFLALAPLETEM